MTITIKQLEICMNFHMEGSFDGFENDEAEQKAAEMYAKGEGKYQQDIQHIQSGAYDPKDITEIIEKYVTTEYIPGDPQCMIAINNEWVGGWEEEYEERFIARQAREAAAEREE